MLTVRPGLSIPRAEVRLSFVRSSGPGGQNVNKVSSKAVLRWNAVASPALAAADCGHRTLAKLARRLTADGELVIASQRFRDAPRNAEDCWDKLRALLFDASSVPKRRRPTRPTRGSVERRRKAKQQRSDKKRSRRELDG